MELIGFQSRGSWPRWTW